MEKIAEYQRRTVFNDHPVVIEKYLLPVTDDNKNTTVPAGTVLGLNTDNKLAPWKNTGLTFPCILAADVRMKEADLWVDVVVHGQGVYSQLVFGADCATAEEKKKAVTALRTAGLYAKED